MKKINFTKPDFTKFKTKVTEEFREIRNDKKKLAIWITSAVTVAALILCAVIFLPGAIKGNVSSDSDTVSSNKVTATTTQKSSTNTITSKKKSKATATPTEVPTSASPTPSAKTETKKEAKTSDKADSKKTDEKSTATASKNNKTAEKTNGATASKNNSTTTKKSNTKTGSGFSNGGNAKSGNSTSSKTTPACSPSGHYETVVDQAAYDEQVQTGTQWVQDSAAWDEPVYGWVSTTICNACGKTFTGANQVYDCGEHIILDHDGAGTYHTDEKQVQTGTTHHEATGHNEPVYQTVHHDAVTHQQWVQDRGC